MLRAHNPPPPPQKKPRAPPASNEFTSFQLALVRPEAIVPILAEDYASTMSGVASYTIYLLNPKIQGAYAYAYDSE